MKFNPIQSVLFIILLTFTFCKKDAEAKEKKADKYKTTENSKSYFITAVGGLRLREEPSSKSKAMTVIPEGSVITVEGDSNVQENIGTVKGTWLKTTWVNDTGFVHSGFLCNVDSEDCSDLKKFLEYFRQVCEKEECYSRKKFEEGDEGSMWNKPARFTVSQDKDGILLYLGTKYVPTTGIILSVKKIRDTYYIYFNGIYSKQILRVKEKASGGAFYSHSPSDYSLPLNDFSNTLIEYSSSYE